MRRPLVKIKGDYMSKHLNEGDFGLIIEFNVQGMNSIVLLKNASFVKIENNGFRSFKCIGEDTIEGFLEVNKRKLLSEKKES